MNKKWIKYTLPETLEIDEVRAWCKQNCRSRHSIRVPKRKFTYIGYDGKGQAKFQNEQDALLFKLKWL